MSTKPFLFGFEQFRVDNCRSKGLHNDSDWLTVTVSTNKNVFPTQVLPLNNNLHAGDSVSSVYAGPFDIDDDDFVTVTFNVTNLSHSDDQQKEAAIVGLKVGAAVLAGLESLASAGFLGLSTSKLEQGIVGAVSASFEAIAELLGWRPSDPNCNGEVLTRTFAFPPGDLAKRLTFTIGPNSETASSPSECGNPPVSTVVYGFEFALPKQQHVFYRDVNNAIQHIFFDGPTSQLLHDSWTERTGEIAAAGDPATMVTANQQHVFYKGVDRAIHHIFYDAPTNQLLHDNWTQRTGAPGAAGDPKTMITPNQQHVFYRGLDDAIHHIFYDAPTNQLFHDNWTQKAGAPTSGEEPAPMATPNQQHVFFSVVDFAGGQTEGELHHIFFDAPTNQLLHDNWTQTTGAPKVRKGPTTMATPDQQHVFYTSKDGDIHHLFFDAPTGRLLHDDWIQRTGAPAADVDSGLATMVTPNQQHIFYRAEDGAIHYIFFDAPTNQLLHDNWTQSAGAPIAAGDPVTLATPNQQHVFYKAIDGAIHHIFFDAPTNQLLHDNWTQRTGTPMPLANLATMATG